MYKRTWLIFIIGVLLMACSQSQQSPNSQTATRCLEEAEAAFTKDSIRTGTPIILRTSD